MDHSHLTEKELLERNRKKVPFHVIINPKITLLDGEPVEFFEGCLSIPEFCGVVPRAKQVRVECYNERGEPQVIEADGWYARILQHEIDHLNGIVFTDRALKETLMLKDQYGKHWGGVPIEDLIERNCIQYLQ